MPALFKKEFLSFFITPLGYIFMGVFLLISGLFFTMGNIFAMSSDYSSFLGGLILIFLLVVPLLTMRMFSEEKRQKTDQLLLTAPCPVSHIVAGKFLAALALFALTLAVTGIYPLMLSFHAQLEGARILGTYIGFFFLGSSFISLGIFASSLTESQAGAAILTFCLLLITWIMDFLGGFLPVSILSGVIFALLLVSLAVLWIYNSSRSLPAAGVSLFLGLVIIGGLYLINKELFVNLGGKTFRWFSLIKRFSYFPMGILKPASIVYYLSFSGFFLFLTTQNIEKQRWS